MDHERTRTRIMYQERDGKKCLLSYLIIALCLSSRINSLIPKLLLPFRPLWNRDLIS
jgi:hypothetical protein